MSELSNVTFSEVCDIIEGAGSVLILTHMRPDPDTIGSAFALRELIRGLGKACEVINPDETVPRRLKFIFGADSMRPELLPEGFNPELIISVDVSTAKLLGDLESVYSAQTELAIDHHALGTPFAKKTYVGDVGACGEIIFDIFSEFKSRGRDLLTKEAAIALYAAICSDTGSFKFESVTPKTHHRIASLLETGFNHAEVARRLYDSRPISQVMATKVALNNLHFYNDNRVAVINFTHQMMSDNDLTKEDIDDIISLTRSIEGVELGMSIKQDTENHSLFKVSMRSNRVVDVSKLCAVFDGGGHKRASGCTLTAENEHAAEAALIEAINHEFELLDASGAFLDAGEI